MTGPLCYQTTPTSCLLISSKFKWSPDAQQTHQCSFWFPPTYMWWLTGAKIKGTDIQCASTGIHCGWFKEMALLKAEVITTGTCANVLHSQSPLFVKQFTLAFTNFYYNFLALSLQQKSLEDRLNDNTTLFSELPPASVSCTTHCLQTKAVQLDFLLEYCM